MREDGTRPIDALLALLSREHDVLPGMIFGHRCLKTAAPRRVFAFERGEAVVFRLDEEERERVGAWPGVVTFRPFGRAPMIGWLEVPPEHRAAWAELAERALDGLRREPADAAPGGRPDPRRR